MAKKLSFTSTKQEILDAYEALLKERQKLETGQAAKEPEADQQPKPAPQPASRLMKDIADLRIGLSESLDELEKKLIEQNKKLAEIHDAVKNEQNQLENLYGIKAQAESLSVLMEAHRQQKSAFEKEMAETRESWKIEKDAREKDRKREEEEYSYRIKRERQKEEDEYNLRKAKLEYDLAAKKENFEKNMLDREAMLKNQEEELKRLKALAEGFPAELSKAVKDTEKAIVERIETGFKHEKMILEKDYKAEILLRDERLKAFEAKVKELNEQIRALQARVEIAEKNAKDIVLKAIESSSDRFDKPRYAAREPETK